MDEDMWKHSSTQNNLNKIRSYGNHIIPVGHGELASGLVGEGRMAEPEDMITFLTDFLSATQPLKGKKALVTAGPTYERIDPVRFIGNFSTGKMGIAISEVLADKGAEVTLVLGPTSERSQHPGVQTVRIESAKELYTESTKAFENADIAVLAAAVADYRPEQMAIEKIKKAESGISISLTKTEDTLLSLGKIKRPDQTLVGFALETTNELEHGMKKLVAKNADMIVLNSLKDEGAGFGHDTNKITLLTRSEAPESLPLLSKKEAAIAIVNHILKLRHAE
jgi:phosphopantothenoylcysteine decarboxylase/phosphopantothenate--cysteine ligase